MTGGLIKQIEADNVKLVELMFTDVLGSLKSVTIPKGRMKEALERGIWFDGSSIEGFARIAESDMFLKPDESTYAVLPWSGEGAATARIICDVFSPNGVQAACDPRNVLRKALQHSSKLGFDFMVGPEMEFFLFKPNAGSLKPVPHDFASYFDFAPRDLASSVRKDIIFALEAMGITVEASHHEVAFGQHEIDFKYDSALKAADNVFTFKHVAKNIAYSHDLYATFMPKPVFGVNGTGMHVHQSLFDGAGKNVFFDKGDKYKLSKTAKHFIAGQLEHVKAMAAVLCPTVNSFKRLVPGFEAPVYLCWAQINRSALIRIPRYSPGREQSIRAELRCPDPSCNPYLAFAVMLEAGLEGIEKETELADPLEEDVYSFKECDIQKAGIETLPDSLKSALDELRKDSLMKRALGEELFEKYIAIKKKEWHEYSTQVTDWELKRYYENT